MPLHSRVNQYRGVNAHLHSVLQNRRAAWTIFHAAHVIDLAREVQRNLPAGYVVAPEASFQIREFHPDTGEPINHRKPRGVRPDISVHEQRASISASAPELFAEAAPVLIAPAIEEIDDPEIYLTAVAIHESDEDLNMGRAVTWIEVLSPTNKPGGTGYLRYRQKRGDAFRSGMALVEIDYLHQSASVSDQVPSYPDGEQKAYPYNILITNPRPTLEEGKLRVYGCHVDDPLPKLTIPLLDTDIVRLDFRAVYNQTFESFPIYNHQVDYAQLPERFDSYSPDDQQRIQARMAAVADAQAKGLDLEQGPFPLPSEAS